MKAREAGRWNLPSQICFSSEVSLYRLVTVGSIYTKENQVSWNQTDFSLSKIQNMGSWTLLPQWVRQSGINWGNLQPWVADEKSSDCTQVSDYPTAARCTGSETRSRIMDTHTHTHSHMHTDREEKVGTKCGETDRRAGWHRRTSAPWHIFTSLCCCPVYTQVWNVFQKPGS